MKNRLHDKKAGIFILIALILISVAEVGFRHMFLRDMIATTANYAETLAVIGLALTIIIFTLKGKDRVCYILYGAWIAYFVFDQIFELPGMIIPLITAIIADGMFTIGNLGFLFHVISMIGIIVIGALLVEYMNDGTIYNKAFNIVSIVTILTILGSIITYILGILDRMPIAGLLVIFNDLYRLAMVFLFAFFAYDSAKKQLNKVNFDK